MPSTVIVLLNSIFSFITLFIIAKMLGKKQVAQLTVVDYVVGISIGSIAAQWCTDAKNPWYYYATGMSIFFILLFLIVFFERKEFIKKFLKGKELEIITNGKINNKNLKKSKLDLQDLHGLCRNKNYFNLNKISYAFFENNGSISIIPKDENRQLELSDFRNENFKKIEPTKYVIVDGKISSKILQQIKKILIGFTKKQKYQTKKS